jgi:hypothetical protein
VKVQKAMDKFVKWANDTGFQISIEKTKLSCSVAKILQKPPDYEYMHQGNEN